MKPYQGYVYSYPHKTAYRPLDPAPALRDVWRHEDKSRLFLYLHIPFCEIRCGFCNLFTRTGAPGELTTAYLDALERQAEAVSDALGPRARFSQAAFGGGTPTYLTASELTRLCELTVRLLSSRPLEGAPPVPLGVETSPGTATRDRLEVLREYGTSRVSIGVQSFVEDEARAAVRPQKTEEVVRALDTIRDVGFSTLNLDLIYGIDGQTAESWLRSIDRALEWKPEELYLYPLYVRPLTGLGRREGDWDDQRSRLYRLGRDHLLAQGYEQVSMRMFRLPGSGAGGGEHSCQEDGMVGLGCGARSYTAGLHYSFEYAVHATEVRAIIDDYVRTEDFTRARVGFTMTDGERRRRHLLQSLLQAEGLDRRAYRVRFGTDVLSDFDLSPFAARGWLEETSDALTLTPEGLAYSDALGPALFSPEVRALMDTYEAR
ncbi:STM4012 family radical SAM protein [Actinocorallia sp. B10E7]|uniref:STM4012 family radical SAM protein n=1 Tax=Actinocorallia sp. B10E7 TaxID=3153558 RepID=UPI00325DD70A